MKLTILLFSITCKAFCTDKPKGPSTEPLPGPLGTAMWNEIQRLFLFWDGSSGSSKTGFICSGHPLVTTSVSLWPLSIYLRESTECLLQGLRAVWSWMSQGTQVSTVCEDTRLEHWSTLELCFNFLSYRASCHIPACKKTLLTEELGFQCVPISWVRWNLNSQ